MSFVTSEQLMSSPRGVACTFVKIGNAGLKIFTSRYVRDGSYQLQRFFHADGFAPYCHFPLDFAGPDGQMLYAYWTDCVEVFDKAKDGGSHEKWREWTSAASVLAADLKENYGCEWSDDHAGNVGMMNGRPVCIDCDPEYFYDLPAGWDDCPVEVGMAA